MLMNCMFPSIRFGINYQFADFLFYTHTHTHIYPLWLSYFILVSNILFKMNCILEFIVHFLYVTSNLNLVPKIHYLWETSNSFFSWAITLLSPTASLFISFSFLRASIVAISIPLKFLNVYPGYLQWFENWHYRALWLSNSVMIIKISADFEVIFWIRTISLLSSMVFVISPVLWFNINLSLSSDQNGLHLLLYRQMV